MVSKPHTSRANPSAAVPATAGIARLVPGVAFSAVIMLISLRLADWLGRIILAAQGLDPASASSPVSGVLVAIVVGIIIRNSVPLPDILQPGIRFSVRSILRLGIVLVGIKLSLLEMLRLGAWGIPIVVVTVGGGLILVTWINRALQLPPRLGTLIAAGTGICGVTAIVSVAPAIQAEDREVAYAIANVTLFGLLGMFLYPYLAPHLLSTSEQIGMFLGVAVHETAQVVGAALTYREVFGDDVAFQVATVTKLTRNLLLAAVVPLLALTHMREQRQSEAAGEPGQSWSWSQAIPTFVLGFILMALVRTVGDATLARGAAFGLFGADAWSAILRAAGDVWGSKYLLGTAMAAVGLGTSLSVFRGVGIKPFLVGLTGALLVGVVGFVMVLLLGPFVSL